MKEVLFIKKSLFGATGEKRLVTDRAAEQYAKLGIIKEEKQDDVLDAEIKELIPEVETKPLEPVSETKEVKVTTSPKEKVKVTKKVAKGKK